MLYIYIYTHTHIIFVLQKNGIEKNLGIGNLSSFEKELLQKALPELMKNIQKGEDFINKN